MNEKKCISVCSSGMDSTTAAYIMKSEGYNVILMFFDYGSTACKAEKHQIMQIGKESGMEVEIIDLKWLGRLGGSPLTDRKQELPEGKESTDTCACWVPFRNGMFLSYATAYAEAHGIDVITIGYNATESGKSGGNPYPDHTLEAIIAWNETIKHYTKDYRRLPIKLIAPCSEMTKTQIISKAVELRVPIHLLHSCDRSLPKNVHCGRCGCCCHSRLALEKAGIKDPKVYQDNRIYNEWKTSASREYV